MSKTLKVLIGCERSGVVRRAFRTLGHDAWSCDIEPAQDGGEHFQKDVREMLCVDFDLAILHPPCTRLANSGVLRLYNGSKKEGGLNHAKMENMRAGADFFAQLWHAPIPFLCVENPIQHCYATEQLTALGVPPYTQMIQPYEFGEPESKATCLWLRGLPPLMPTTAQVPDLFLGHLPKPEVGHWNNQCPGGQNKLPPSPERAAIRAQTYNGIAVQMAAQWSAHVLKWKEKPCPC